MKREEELIVNRAGSMLKTEASPRIRINRYRAFVSSMLGLLHSIFSYANLVFSNSFYSFVTFSRWLVSNGHVIVHTHIFHSCFA